MNFKCCGRVSQLKAELDSIKKSAEKSLFGLESIKEKDELIKCYTGFPDYTTLFTFYEKLLESDAMCQWYGKNSSKNYDESKRGRPCILC